MAVQEDSLLRQLELEKLEQLALSEGPTRPKEALKLLLTVVRTACTSAQVITQRRAFDTFFKTSKNRKWGGEAVAYKSQPYL